MAKADDTPAAAETETPAGPVSDTLVAEAAPEVQSDPNFVSYRVLKAGDGQVHTGRFNTELAQAETFSKGDVVENVPRSIAEELEDRHFVEILD